MPQPDQILVVEDDAVLRNELATALCEAGWHARAVDRAEAALELVQRSSFDLCLTDIRLPGMDGIELLRRLTELCPETSTVVMTAFGETRSAIDALRAGAADYLLKPFLLEDLLTKARRLLEHRRLTMELGTLRRATSPSSGELGMVGRSSAMESVTRLIHKVAGTPSTVIITGESGTGKELVARAIHSSGSSPQAPFVPINCAAIPENLLESELFGYMKGAFTGAAASKEGLLQAARSGTVFLDEVMELPLALQAKLLRVLETREVQPLGSVRRLPIRARIVSATNREAAVAVTTGAFREDLYYRISVVEIPVPPLRDRREDIPALVEHFIRRLNPKLGRSFTGATNEAMQQLVGYHWKGNVRELENVIERALIIGEGERIQVEDLPDAVQAASAVGSESLLDLKAATQRFQRRHVERVVEQCDGDKARAAHALGISLSSLYRKLADEGHET